MTSISHISVLPYVDGNQQQQQQHIHMCAISDLGEKREEEEIDFFKMGFGWLNRLASMTE